jgi:acyl-CoA synthetase (AMP-forming)/AMP-acid ligase II
VTRKEIVEGRTFWELLERRVERTPDRLMYVDGDDRRLTFSEFKAKCERAAAGLQSIGVREGTRFSWQLPTGIDTVVLSVALSRLGAIQNPIIALYREREVGSLLEQTSAEWYAVLGEWRNFSYSKMAEDLRSRSADPFEIFRVEEGLPEGDPDSLPPPPTDPDAIRWLYSTSGTTSAPKVVLHTDGSLIAGGSGIADAVLPQEGDVGSIVYPYAHIGGPDYLVMQLRYGLPTLLLDVFAVPDSLEQLRRHRVSISGGSTAHYLMILEEQRNQPSEPILPSLRILSGGGAPMSPDVYWQVLEEVGATILHGYGMTECPMIANGSLEDTDDQRAHTEGKPVAGCEVKIVDADGGAVAAGVDGDVLVRGPMVATGYLDQDATKEAFLADGFFRTGDRGHLREDGHIALTGRSKDMIIRKGENISPGEIEDVLMAHPKVGAVAVIGLPDAQRGERVCAVVETSGAESGLTFAEMQQACRAAGLMTQKIPEQLELVDELPRNPTLKILKRDLVERFAKEGVDHGDKSN